MKKFFIEKQNIDKNQIVITNDEFFHFKNVLRTRLHEKIICICGDENYYHCEVTKIEKTYAIANILKIEKCPANPKIDITVFQGLPKADKLELIVQKISELGATTLIPFESEFTIAKNNNLKIERLKKIAKEACKQCGRSLPIKISNTIKFKDINNYLTDFDLVLFLNEKSEGKNKINNLINEINSSKKIAVIIGAEGGFSNTEINLLSNKKIMDISLGKRILRTETATIALVSFLSILSNNQLN